MTDRRQPPGTAVTAALLAILGGLVAAAVLVWLMPTGVPGGGDGLVAGLVLVAEAVLLVPGGVLLALRRLPGVPLIVAGCVLHIVACCAMAAGATAEDPAPVRPPSDPGGALRPGVTALLLLLLPAVVTLVAALRADTRTWIRARRTAAVNQE